jgi:hypothetical protein
MPGRLIKVSKEVSVATIENIDFFHEIVLFPRKYSLSVKLFLN